MEEKYYFPFGQELKKVTQKDRDPKKVFVLGVYSSALHAKWLDVRGRAKVQALAVASEPEIFWRGENAEEEISKIKIPPELGRLVPAIKKYNGPSGRALDELFLNPIGIDRKNAWLCDLLPESRANENQYKAISEYYTYDIINKYGLTPATIPRFYKSELNSEIRRSEILRELEQSQASKIILLGDLPILWFLRFYADQPYSKLSQFGESQSSYGQEHEMKINSLNYTVIPLCHPRQADKLGRSNSKWGQLHDNWIINN